MCRSFKAYATAFFVMALTPWLSIPSFASDALHMCVSVGGYFNLIDGKLRAGDGNSVIPYKVLRQRVLRNRQGFCISKRAPKKTYEFEMRSYVMLLQFRYQNNDMLVDFICEDAKNGLPAALNCDRERVTIDNQNY